MTVRLFITNWKNIFMFVKVNLGKGFGLLYTPASATLSSPFYYIIYLFKKNF